MTATHTHTQIWPHKEFPLIPVGKMVLDRNPKNYFAEVEQMAYEPSNMPPGIETSPDKMLQVCVCACAWRMKLSVKGHSWGLCAVYLTPALDYTSANMADTCNVQYRSHVR